MPQKTKQQELKSVVASNYAALVKQIQEELSSLDFFIKRRTAEAYWRVGRFIHEHLLENKQRADYGHNLFERLAKDVDRDSSTLARAVKFYRAYPILARGQELSWSHYRMLITIKDEDQRKRLEAEVIQKKWDSQQLREYLNQQRDAEVIKADSNKPVPKLDFIRGRLYTYALSRPAESGDELLLDLGFRMRRVFEQAGSLRLKEEDRVYAVKHNDTFSFTKTTAPKEELFTYTAQVERVIDGDTLWAIIDVRFGIFIEQKLRLRGIDCAEINTEEGQAAKRFVQGRLKGLPFIVIKTHKDSTDKYDRYLADIFYLPTPKLQQTGLPGETDAERIAREGRYLNQELLDEHLAYVWK